MSDKFELDRRTALKALAGAASTLMASCSQPDEEIIPYVNMPEGLVAGEPMRFATTLTLGGYGRGFLAIAVDGHPIKIEGNPRHPFSLGATDVFAEAEVISLYDPDRSRMVRQAGQASSWKAFAEAWTRAAAPQPDKVALVTGRTVSPTTLAGIAALRRTWPEMRWYRAEAANDDMARGGARLAFGRVLEVLPHWDQADVVLLLDAHPLDPGPDLMRNGRAHATRRGALDRRQRIFAAEPAWSLSGATADRRIALRPGAIREVARMVANELGASLGAPRLSDEASAFAREVATALTAAQGRALVLVGEGQALEVHALAHWINERLRGPVTLLPSQDSVEMDHGASLQALASDLHDGRVDAVMVADANPVYDAPDALGLGDAIGRLAFSASLGCLNDETAARCQWQLPLSHGLESWGDARALNGAASLVQPLIRPLYDTKTTDEVIALLLGRGDACGYDLTRGIWQPQAQGEFEGWWRRMLNDGVIAGTEAQAVMRGAALPQVPPAEQGGTYEVVLTPDPSLWDGRYANNAWLQECPKPFTRQVWGNAAQMAPEDAAVLGLTNDDTLEITLGGKHVMLPIAITAGQARGVVATTLGGGRWAAGRIGNGIGTRLCGLVQAPYARTLADVKLSKSGDTVPFRSPQLHTHLVGAAEELFRITTVAALRGTQPDKPPPPPSLLPIPERGEYAWAMVVNTDACIGCNACVVACQAENNVPIVGPDEIAEGRDMHWLRVDGYTSVVTGEDARSGFQPVPCMHCELAPCEPVCPVEASVHDHEGLNVQVYNRCIGTRFCQANCPYKVRRFNWFAYAGDQAYGGQTAALKAQHNPDVSSRNRGVMEKCNYCLQRISRARHAAEREDRPIGEGEVVTACQAACPTRAIHFGDLNRADSAVSTLRGVPQHYTLLEELNTRPRTTYLKRIYNDGKAT